MNTVTRTPKTTAPDAGSLLSRHSSLTWVVAGNAPILFLIIFSQYPAIGKQRKREAKRFCASCSSFMIES